MSAGRRIVNHPVEYGGWVQRARSALARGGGAKASSGFIVLYHGFGSFDRGQIDA
jgi:hypothetical protein